MRKSFNFYIPIILLVVLNAISYGQLYYNVKPLDKVGLLLGLAIVGALLLGYIFIVSFKFGDEYLFLIVSALLSIGSVMIYRLDKQEGIKQAMWFGVGICLFFIVYWVYIKAKKWDRLALVYIILSIGFLLVTSVFGRNVRGATNWIVVGSFRIQLSEAVKVLLILFIGCYYKVPDKLFFYAIDNKPTLLSKYPALSHRVGLINKLILMGIVYLMVGFLLLQREWGTAALIFSLFIVFLYIYSPSRSFVVLNSIFALPFAFGGYYFMSHIRTRVNTWINPWADISGKGYQITQSLFGISSGGYFGKGIGLGNPYLIPAADTDFIFSSICEEMGVFTGVAVILLYLMLAYRGFKIALTVRRPFHRIVAIGITAMFGLQTFIIIGGVIKLIPLTGITLPFISYGGSSLIVSFATLGILQAISKLANDPLEEANEDEQGE